MDITASSVQFLGGGQVPGEADGGEVDMNDDSENGQESVEVAAAAAGHTVDDSDLPF